MKTYYLIHATMLAPLFNDILSHDSVGMFLLEHDTSDGKTMPIEVRAVSPVVFSVADSGIIEMSKDDLMLGEFSHNLAALDSSVPKVTYGTLYSTARVTEGVGSLKSYFNVKSQSLREHRLVPPWLEAQGKPELIHESHSLTMQHVWKQSTLVHTLKRMCNHIVQIETREDKRFPTGYRNPQEDFEGKGELGGRCNVNACQLPGSAFFFNTGRQAYYCYHCALGLHNANRQHYHEFGPLISKELLAEARNSGELSMVSIIGQREWLKAEKAKVLEASR